MTLALIGLLVTGFLELLIYTPLLWPAKRLVAVFCLIAVAVSSGLVLGHGFSLVATGFLIVQLYRMFNLLRLVQSRMHQSYLRQVTLRTSLALLTIGFVITAIWSISVLWVPTVNWVWGVIAVLQLGLTLTIGGLLYIGRRRATVPLHKLHSANRDLPSISVAIPARNETETLERCLRSLLASDYPKLEILVLDDESHDRTPDIIRSFAHDGVRFIKGNTPPSSWLAKNWAYQRLFEEASGELIVFAGVDIRFQPDSLRSMVLHLVTRNLDMISFMPLNNPSGEFRTMLLQPIRYGWELVVSQLPNHRPALLSSCWIVRKTLLHKNGGFASMQRAIIPEGRFARAAGGKYAFLRTNEVVSITSDKRFTAQLATALRTRYPQLHRRPEAVMSFSALEALLLLPYPLLVAALLNGWWLTAIICSLTIAVQNDAYALLVKLTYGQSQWRGTFIAPFALVLDIVIRHISMWRYEFGQVTWKERDITAPVMHVESHLPKL